jgi:FMN reductase
MSDRRLAVVTAGLSQPSSTRLLADQLAVAAERALQERGVRSSTEVVELRDQAQDLTNNLLTGFASPSLRAAIDAVLEADALIAVTPVFTASYSGLFKTFFDVLDPDGLVGKPVLMAATAGTARHSLVLEHAMRPLFAHLRAVAVPTAVFAASEDWGSGDAGTDPLAFRIARASDEVADLVVGRGAGRAADPFDQPVPFEQLLRQGGGVQQH